jgi:hypothetical protein
MCKKRDRKKSAFLHPKKSVPKKSWVKKITQGHTWEKKDQIWTPSVAKHVDDRSQSSKSLFVDEKC